MTHSEDATTNDSGADRALVSLTPKALESLRASARRDRLSHPVLRVGVTGGSCSGFEYVLTFEEGPKPGDEVVDVDGLRIVVDAASEKFIRGVTIDYVTNLHGSAFKFLNPNPQSSCGCGSSSSASPGHPRG